LRFGTRAALTSAMGNTAGLVMLGYGVTMGLGAVLAASALPFTVVQLSGAVYLVYLGTKILRDKTALRVDTDESKAPQSRRNLFTTALIVSLTNPKAIFLIGALFPQFTSPGQVDLVELSILSFSYAAMCYLNHAFLALFGGRMRRYLQSARIIKRVRQSLGTLFIGFGAALATYTR